MEIAQNVGESEIAHRCLVLRTIGIVVFVTVYVSLLLFMFPMETREKIESGQKLTVCEWNESANTAYQALMSIEIVALFLMARLGWLLERQNAIYNESLYISVINLSAVFIVSGYLVAEHMKQTASSIVIQSYLVTLLVVLVISLLMVPKLLVIILSDKEYEPDHFESDSITFSSSVLTKEDVRAMRRLCRKHGYHIDQADKIKLQEANLSVTATQSKRGKIGSWSSKQESMTRPLASS